MKILDNRIELTGQLQEYPWGKRHLASDRDLERQLQVVEVHRLAFGRDAEVRQYVKAAYALGQFTHAQINQVIGVKRAEDGTVFIVQDYAEGTSLRQLLARHGERMTPELAVHLLAQVARALAAAHDARDRQTAQSQKLFHLGLNPDTIRITAKGEVRLIDFQFPPEQIKSAAQVAYLAPEQIQGAATDQRTDLFSLAVVGYELFCGRRLFTEDNVSELMAMILHGEYDVSALDRSKVDRRVTELVAGCLRLHRNERLVTAAQFGDRCESVLREAGVHPEKRLREIVENAAESPKLEPYPAGRSERVRTRALERTDLEEGTQAMVEPHRNDRDDERRSRAGQETRISSMPVGERLKRAQRSGFGGNRTVFVLGIFAAVLVLAAGVLVILKLTSGSGGSTEESPVSGMKTGTINSVPDGVAVYSADSLLGYTPLRLTLPEGELLTLKHPCCPDSNIILNFDRIAETPYVMRTVVEITSNPVGAKITLNGQDIGATTPYQFATAASDTIQFTLEIPNKKVIASGPIALAEFSSLNLKDIDVAKRPGGGVEFSGSFTDRPKTQIITYPRGASVKITATNMEIGTTPKAFDFGDEPVMLQISLPGFEDGILEIPAIGKRQPTYKTYLFRRVDIQAYEHGHPDRTVNAHIKEVVYDGKSHPSREMTPASVRLPGIECRLVLGADGYMETDTIVTPLAKEFTVVMRKREGSAPKQTESPPPQSASGSQAEVRIFVVDDKERPIPNVVVTAEYKVGKDKQLDDLGRTDSNGRVTANLNPNKYKFLATHEEYKNKDESREVKAGQTYVVQIKMKRR